MMMYKTTVVSLFSAILLCVCVAAAAQNYNTHIVKKGETISSISKAYGIHEAEIIRLNPKAAKFVYVGMELTMPAKAADKSNNEEESLQSSSMINHRLIIKPSSSQQERKGSAADSGKNTGLDNIQVDFVPSFFGGFSNFVSPEASPIGRFGFGFDLSLQFIALERISFVPKDYFMDFSIGYSLKGSGAFPMHYLTAKLSPVGYRYNVSDYLLYGRFGVLFGYTFSTVRIQDKVEFNSRPDFGLLGEIGVEFKRIGVGLSYERGLTKVCDSELKLNNSFLFLKLSYRLFNVNRLISNN